MARGYRQRVWPRGKPGASTHFKVGNLQGIAAQKRKLTEADVRYIRRCAALARWLRKNDPKRQHQRFYPKGFRVRLVEHFRAKGIDITVHAIKKVLYRQRWPHVRVDLRARHRTTLKVPKIKKGKLQ